MENLNAKTMNDIFDFLNGKNGNATITGNKNVFDVFNYEALGYNMLFATESNNTHDFLWSLDLKDKIWYPRCSEDSEHDWEKQKPVENTKTTLLYTENKDNTISLKKYWDDDYIFYLDYENWLSENEENLQNLFEQNGSTGEMDFDFEKETKVEYQKYLNKTFY